MSEKLKFKIRELNKSFGSHHVLQGINLDVKKDSSLVILGGSGSGKSVLIKSMVGLLSPDQVVYYSMVLNRLALLIKSV